MPNESSDASPSRSASAPLLLASLDFDAPGRTGLVARALEWVGPLVSRLSRAGLDVEAVPLPAAETEGIAVRRRGIGPRLALVFEIGPRAVEIALEIPPGSPELDALRAAVRAEGAPEWVEHTLEHLPEPFALSLHGEAARPVAALVEDARAAAAWLEALASRAIDEGRKLRIGWQLARDTALEHAAILDEQLEGALASLAVPFASLQRGPSRASRSVVPPRSGAARGQIAPGANVRVRSGAFEGKVGVVDELDGRGGARVLFGLLSVRVRASELQALVVGVARPALGSSHRRR